MLNFLDIKHKHKKSTFIKQSNHIVPFLQKLIDSDNMSKRKLSPIKKCMLCLCVLRYFMIVIH